MTETVQEKRCPRCEKVLSLELFTSDRTRPLGKSLICKSCDTKRHAIWRENNRETYRQNRYRQIAKYPEKQKARVKVKDALKRGLLKKLPCEECGETVVHAHHEDYTKPLEVIWLCVKHHVLKHQ